MILLLYLFNSLIIDVVIGISYRVTGLYRLGKTCYLHSLVCNNSIICVVVQNDIISICTWENDNSHLSRHFKHVTGDVPLFAQKSCYEDAI